MFCINDVLLGKFILVFGLTAIDHQMSPGHCIGSSINKSVKFASVLPQSIPTASLPLPPPWQSSHCSNYPDSNSQEKALTRRWSLAPKNNSLLSFSSISPVCYKVQRVQGIVFPFFHLKFNYCRFCGSCWSDWLIVLFVFVFCPCLYLVMARPTPSMPLLTISYSFRFRWCHWSSVHKRCHKGRKNKTGL